MLTLANPKIVGEGEHRSGWPYVIDCCQSLLCDDAPVLFDDFAERSFLYSKKWNEGSIYHQPWITVIHHPPDMPQWYMPEMHLQELLKKPRFVESLPHLKLIISLGEPLTSWLQENLPEVPVVTLRHPTGRPLMYWTPQRWRKNQYKMMIQVGWFLRNVSSIYQCPPIPKRLSKAHLKNSSPWIDFAARLCRNAMSRMRSDLPHDDRSVTQIPKQNDAWYDVLLSENIVFVELLSAVANNTVVECIARNTPIVVNRHPGPMSYLGPDYPLYYDDLREVPDLLTEDRIMAAHYHLARLDKWWIRGPLFAEHLRNACVQHVPELAGYDWPETTPLQCDL